ncbi:MAG: pyrroloquinoline quinone biosynthesis protein PqqB [Pyrinomonadaceae bacterium]|nr:pyrroloquinoline quinone biosynthesis protein PqqB [Pyrinomonadaceae bacterium]
MKLITLTLFLLFSSLIATAGSPYVLVLGTAQDAGAPQMGCMSAFCKRAWEKQRYRKMVSSLALVNPDTNQRWIFDATPDLPAQFQMLKEKTRDFSNRLDGIFLTHAHIGHYTGLIYLGRESMGSKGVSVYAMPRMSEMLRKNAPWSQLVNLKNISIEPLSANRAQPIAAGLKVTPILVPHRDEFSETVGFQIQSAAKSLIFIPDIDKWEKWDRRLVDVIRANDYVFVDATFFGDGEISRPMSEVPHPFVSETMSLLSDVPPEHKKKVRFIHFNHSNPLIQGDKAKIKQVKRSGFNIAVTGQVIKL